MVNRASSGFSVPESGMGATRCRSTSVAMPFSNASGASQPPSGPIPVQTCSAAARQNELGEDPEPAEQRLLSAVQQLVAPGHRRPHAQLPGGQVDRAVRQQSEDPAVVGQPQLSEQRDG